MEREKEGKGNTDSFGAWNLAQLENEWHFNPPQDEGSGGEGGRRRRGGGGRRPPL